MIKVSANAIVVMLLQYKDASSQHIVHLRFRTCYMPIISQKKKGKKKWLCTSNPSFCRHCLYHHNHTARGNSTNTVLWVGKNQNEQRIHSLAFGVRSFINLYPKRITSHDSSTREKKSFDFFRNLALNGEIRHEVLTINQSMRRTEDKVKIFPLPRQGKLQTVGKKGQVTGYLRLEVMMEGMEILMESLEELRRFQSRRGHFLTSHGVTWENASLKDVY